MAGFVGSTQRREWLFETQADIDALRNKAREVCLAKSTSEREPLSPSAEAGFLNLYLTLMRKLCTRKDLNPCLTEAKYSQRVYLTAAALFKRFYLKHSAMAVNPKLMSSVAIYVASKVVELPLPSNKGLRGIEVEALAKLAKLHPSLIVDNEIRFLSGIDFQMYVHHASEPFESILSQLETTKPEHGAIWASMRKFGKAFLEETLCTDASFLFPPSRIAFAALLDAAARTREQTGDAPFTDNNLIAWALPASAQVDEGQINTLISIKQAILDAQQNVKKCNVLVSKEQRTESMNNWANWWQKEFSKAPANGENKRKREDE